MQASDDDKVSQNREENKYKKTNRTPDIYIYSYKQRNFMEYVRTNICKHIHYYNYNISLLTI